MTTSSVDEGFRATAGTLWRRHPRTVVALVSGAASALFVGASYQEAGRFTLFDDAMVSMTYARTMADGRGITWQPGAKPVQGYTDPLWMFLMGAFHWLGLGAGGVSLLMIVVSAGLIIGCALLARAIAARIAPDATTGPFVAGVVTGVFPPLLYWSLRGMEVGLFTFLVLALSFICMTLRSKPSVRLTVLACVVATAGLLTRTDFLVPATAMVLWMAIVGSRRLRGRVVVPLAVTIAAVLGLTTWLQDWYYGSSLPNMYYLKLVGTPLSDRLGRGLLVVGVQLVGGGAVLLALTVLSWFKAARRPELTLMVTIAVAIVGYLVYVGGDAWEWTGLADRYLVPAFVALIVTAATGIEPAVHAIRGTRHPSRVLAVVIIVASVFGVAGQSVLLGAGLPSAWLQVVGKDWPRSVALGLATAVLLSFVTVRVIGRREGQPSAGTAAALLAGGLLLAVGGPAFVNWSAHGLPHVADDGNASRYGEVIRDITTDDATVAVAWAGALPYYSGRTSFDLLGKTDPVIAHEAPHLHIPLRPGHNKWDYGYTISQLAPDVIAQLPSDSGGDGYRLAIQQGYIAVQPISDSARATADATPWSVLLVRRGSPNIRWDRLEPVG